MTSYLTVIPHYIFTHTIEAILKKIYIFKFYFNEIINVPYSDPNDRTAGGLTIPNSTV